MSDSLPSILHVEDNQDIAMVVARILQSVARITHVRSLEEAREKLKREKFALAIVDLVLPDGSGFDIVPELKNDMPPMPVIIHSAHEVSETVHNVDAVLPKAYTKHQDLRDVVSRFLSGEIEEEQEMVLVEGL